MNKARGWMEVVTDVVDLFFDAIASKKGLELLDEIATLLELPDPLPDVDGLKADDGQGVPVAQPESELDKFQRILEANANVIGLTEIKEGEEPKRLTHKDILALRRAKEAKAAK